jgi:hypothetical protein
VQSQQLLPESQVFEKEILARTEGAQKPTEEVSQQRGHGARILSEHVSLSFAASL